LINYHLKMIIKTINGKSQDLSTINFSDAIALVSNETEEIEALPVAA
jgi:hypothetical protein